MAEGAEYLLTHLQLASRELAGADGTGLARVAQSVAGHHHPSWSPDGSRLAFATRGGTAIVNADGTGLQEFTMDGFAFDPSWSPDGTRLVYIHRQDVGSVTEIFVMHVFDTWKVQLTVSDGASFPRWRPPTGSPVARSLR